jgi:hypothetical protein
MWGAWMNGLVHATLRSDKSGAERKTQAGSGQSGQLHLCT